jgi:2-iminoacetate synthase
MSAASRTSPLGYSHEGDAEPQFCVLDTRSSLEVADALVNAGYEPVRKDWDESFLNTETIG